jgi:hypothetical protein
MIFTHYIGYLRNINRPSRLPPLLPPSSFHATRKTIDFVPLLFVKFGFDLSEKYVIKIALCALGVSVCLLISNHEAVGTGSILIG